MPITTLNEIILTKLTLTFREKIIWN